MGVSVGSVRLVSYQQFIVINLKSYCFQGNRYIPLWYYRMTSVGGTDTSMTVKHMMIATRSCLSGNMSQVDEIIK